MIKIDIHAHTKKCKSGDAYTREITPESFCEKMMATDVGIIAITNHNFFDLVQYQKIMSIIDDNLQVWPGIELDVVEDGVRGHLIVIVSPNDVVQFSDVIKKITNKITPDNFTTCINTILENFDFFKPLYIAHYNQKTPSLSNHVIDNLTSRTSCPGRVIKEVTNSISAGIYISHGYPSIYGSDIQDWSNYEEVALDLPDLRLPVESFEHFCLLLEKDPTTINTVLNKKIGENLLLTPFEDDTHIRIRVYNDINIVFGPKGTGKSCILESIAKYYSGNGLEAYVYSSASDRLDEIFDIKGRDLSINLNTLSINYCKDEIESLRNASEVNVTSIMKYVTYFKTKTTNNNAKKIKLKDIEIEDEGNARREFGEFNDAVLKAHEFISFLECSAIAKELNEFELAELNMIVLNLLTRLQKREWENYVGWKEICLLNSAIAKFRSEVERKTGSPAKPTTTGFREYALNRAKIELNTTAIIKSFDTEIPMQSDYVGSLGSDKGLLELRTKFKFQDGTISDSSFNKLKNVKKGSQKLFSKQVRKIFKHSYQDDLFMHISELNVIEEIENIETVYELLLFKRYFALNGIPYSPSSGEASMVMLNKELETDKDIYILDEPERSLGNEYINDVIVPLIKERARSGKKIFISTHDANIAVRTLPYSSIYRYYGTNGYFTYVGNPFSNNLVNIENEQDQLDWKKISMRTLEGGETAFGERGKIYGKY